MTAPLRYLHLADCWFNLDQVESIETSESTDDAGLPQFTLVIGLASGRIWMRRNLERATYDSYLLAIALALQPAR